MQRSDVARAHTGMLAIATLLGLATLASLMVLLSWLT